MNEHEAEARRRKAMLIHSAVPADVRPEHLAVWDQGQRDRVAALVGKGSPSATTWAQVVELRQHLPATVAAEPADPFQGLPR